MEEAKLPIENIGLLPVWDTVSEIAKHIQSDVWMLVGGLMVQAHAMLSGHESRATRDIDILIDVLADARNHHTVLRGLEALGFTVCEPALRGTVFHRLMRGDLIVDILVADHLPTVRKEKSTINRWPMMAIPGGAQGLARKMLLQLGTEDDAPKISMPNLLGALILKCAAYQSDTRDKERHLDDIALLSCFITDHRNVLEQLHGSDKKRLRAASAGLANVNHRAWLKLSTEERANGQDTLRILTD
jgi:hypothetical protein